MSYAEWLQKRHHLFRLIRKTSSPIEMQTMSKRMTPPITIGSQLICCNEMGPGVILKEAKAGVG
jgi:hypothetical protein